MRITVRLFARLREIAGQGQMERQFAPGATAQTVWDGLTVEVPDLTPYRTISSCAVNQEYASFTTPVAEGDEVAFLPPVSGGDEGFGIRDRDRDRDKGLG